MCRSSWARVLGSRAFARQGLQFFKVNKTVTHVCVARPHFLDVETTPVSAGVKRIVEFVNAHPKCTRRQLMESQAPAVKPANLPAPAAAPESGGTVPVTQSEGITNTPAPVAPEPTPEQNALIADLHWLIHQGHVIEFANGQMETAKKPAPRPPKPEAKEGKPEAAPKEVKPEEAASTEAPAATEATKPVEPAADPANPETPPPAASV